MVGGLEEEVGGLNEDELDKKLYAHIKSLNNNKGEKRQNGRGKSSHSNDTIKQKCVKQPNQKMDVFRMGKAYDPTIWCLNPPGLL